MLHDWIVGGVYRSHACHMTLDCGRSVQVTCMLHDWIVGGVYRSHACYMTGLWEECAGHMHVT